MRKYKAGDRIGNIELLSCEPSRKCDGKISREKWWYICDCGNVKLTSKECLKAAKPSRSCGCNRRNGENCQSFVHGAATDRVRRWPEYRVWSQIIQRCSNPNQPSNLIPHGIIVCKRWKTFSNFIHDVGRRPHPKAILSRKLWGRDYEPGNAYWIMPKRYSNIKIPQPNFVSRFKRRVA